MNKPDKLRKVMLFFALLDIILLIRFLGLIIGQFGVFVTCLKDPKFVGIMSPIIIETFRLLTYISLPFIIYGFIRSKPWAFILYYVQFPFRILFVILSFGFISLIAKATGSTNLYSVLIYIAMALELVRLVVTVIINKRITSRCS